MTKLERKLQERERRAIREANRSTDDYQDVYEGAMRILFDLVLVIAGVIAGFYLSAARTQAATTVPIPPRCEYVGPITDPVPEELPVGINETLIATMPDAMEAERVGEGHWEYLGRWKTTGYCSCRKCNGRNAGRTASGAPMVPGRTIAVGGLPFGTVLRIGDKEYVVEDRGVRGNHADILYPNHRSASNHGVQFMEVWIRK